MSKYRQKPIWQNGEDTPLFSGVAARCYAPDPRPFPVARSVEQMSMPFKCNVCRDTGTVLTDRRKNVLKFCVCDTGLVARHRSVVVTAIVDLPLGSLATLIGVDPTDVKTLLKMKQSLEFYVQHWSIDFPNWLYAVKAWDQNRLRSLSCNEQRFSNVEYSDDPVPPEDLPTGIDYSQVDQLSSEGDDTTVAAAPAPGNFVIIDW